MLIGGRLFTTILWGWIADRLGLRYSLAASMACVMVGNLCFGFATSLRLSLLARAVFLGACNGFTTLMGPTCALAGPAYQAQAVAHALAAGSAIMMFGPALGGLTYASLGHTYPALAPSLIGASLAALATALCLLNLPHSQAEEARLRRGTMPATQPPAAVAPADDYGHTAANPAKGLDAEALEEATELQEVPGLPSVVASSSGCSSSSSMHRRGSSSSSSGSSSGSITDHTNTIANRASLGTSGSPAAGAPSPSPSQS